MTIVEDNYRVAPAADDLEVPADPRGPIGLYALKDDDTFLVADDLGNVLGRNDGLFREDTRTLSHFGLTIGGALPSLLGSGVSRDNVFFKANLTNRPLPQLGGATIPEGVVHVERARFLWQRRLYERLTLTNYGDNEAPARLTLSFGADFADIFEVRGKKRQTRGRMLPPEIAVDGVMLRYIGLDDIMRSTSIAFSEPPRTLRADRAEFDYLLARQARLELYLEIGPDRPARPSRQRFRAAAAQARRRMRGKRRGGAVLRSSGLLFNVWLEKSRADLALLTTELPSGPYPYAGIPWFSTAFGRDAIITALQTLWLDPTLARGVLSFQAAHQADRTSAFDDSAPGKIMHETRKGEMSVLGEVPFAHYYGGVDSTPLFVLLAGEYARRTADMVFIDRLWPALLRAMDWIEGDGDSNRDGFVDYARGAVTGLANQGWKDSVDSVFHANGATPEGPIALLEVQGYAYAAKRAMADLAARRGERTLAELWRDRADTMRAAIEARFWLPDLKFYALALDGAGNPCRVRASNAGHLLYAGVPSVRRANQVIEQLSSACFDNGWGIRTLAEGEARFNPMSYHNGSVWPHDSALCAAGMARYGDRRSAVRVLNETFKAADHFGMRLPELFCGFARRPGEPPVGYPVACLPQAWSSGAAFMMLHACLGLHIDGWRNQIHIDRPELPAEIERLSVRGLAVGDARIDLVFQRVGGRVIVTADAPVPERVRLLVRV